MEKKNFVLPLHKACSTSSNKSVNPIYKSIFFINGNAYATNGSIIVRHPMHYSNIIDDIGISTPIADGGLGYIVAIPAKSFEQILTFNKAGANHEGITCASEDGRTAFFEYTKLDGINVPDFEEAIKKSIGRPTQLDAISIAPELLEVAAKLLIGGSSGIKLQFTGIDKGIIISHIENLYDDQTVIVIPRIIQPDLFSDDKQGT